MLDFIGTGSAFNTKLGNNGAFIKKGHTLFMIDCGSNTFDRLMKANVLEGIKNICVLMTHTHPDHVGSLGDLIFYSYYNMGEMAKPNLVLLSPPSLNIEKVLESMGVEEELYDLRLIENFMDIQDQDSNFIIRITPVPVTHVNELSCFGYLLEYEGTLAYYSGDSNMIPHKILRDLYQDKIDIFYQDTCKADYPGNVHLSLRRLEELIDPEYRNKVHCMHLDKTFNIKEANDLGFIVVLSII